MKKSAETFTSEETAQPAERHPCLSADFDERLAVARKQREKVLAERAAAAAATVEAPRPTAKRPRPPATGGRATQGNETFSRLGAVASRPGPYRNPKSLVRGIQKDPQPVKRRFRWIAGTTLAGILIGGLSTLMLLDRQSMYEGDETDIVSRAASQPDISWPTPLGPTITKALILSDRSPGLAVSQMDMSTGKSTTPVTTLRPPSEISPPETQDWSSQPTAPAVQFNAPDLDADPSGANTGMPRFPDAGLQDVIRTEPIQQPRSSAADHTPSVDPDSPAPALATWNMVMTTPRQDQPGQASPPSQEWPDQGVYHPALRWPAGPDNFDCQDCQIAVLPAQDQTVILLVSGTSSMQQKNTMLSRISSLGLAQIESHQTPLGASETNVRYFHDVDEAAARAVAQSAQARLVNLSELRPLPPVGTIELRLGPDWPDITKSIQFHSDIKG